MRSTDERLTNVLALDVVGRVGTGGLRTCLGLSHLSRLLSTVVLDGGLLPDHNVHLGQEDTADPAWEIRRPRAESTGLPTATTTHIQSVNDFHSFFPMEVVATESERTEFWNGVDGRLEDSYRSTGTVPFACGESIPRHWTTP